MGRGPDLTLMFADASAVREGEVVHRPLYEGAPDDVPVLALLEDGEPLTNDRLEALGLDAEEAFDEAIEDLDDADAGWIAQAVPVKGGAELHIVVRGGEEAEAVELFGAGVLEAAAELLGATELAVAIPAHGELLATDAGQRWQLVAAFSAAARMRHAAAGEDALWPGVLRAVGGRITGVIELRTASLDAASQAKGSAT